MAPTPKNLILNLLLAADGASLTASDAINSAALFGLRENSVRVALVRLSTAGLITSAGRGAYQLGPQAASLAEDLSRWRSSTARLVDWCGAWIMVSTGALSRSDRSALRVRERALALLGFKELDEALYVRPDNLKGHAAAVRERLSKLGLPAQVPVFRATDLPPELEARARSLWDGAALNQAYTRTRQQLQTWLAHSAELELDVAARESYLLGNDAIHQLVFDPLLPAPLVDMAERQAFIDAVVAFDAAGHRIWQQLLPSLRGERAQGIPLATSPSRPVHH
jgi:phenylacetic acid degradation operon negative regulatory protein